MARYKIVKDKERVYDEELEGSLGNILENIQLYIDKYGKDAYLEHDYGGWDDECREYYVHYEREETDGERNKRLAKARKERERKVAATAAKEEKERKELARLQKKYGED